jgi:C1A family cysteine protease
MPINNPQQNIMTSCGSGWVPDHPDLRDRNLSSGNDGFVNRDVANSRLNKEDSIEFFEDFASQIIDTLKIFIKNSKPSEHDDLLVKKQALERLQDKIFGNIQLTTVKVRRQLGESINDQIAKDRESKENLALIQRVYELKNCLYLLYKNNYLDLTEDYHGPQSQNILDPEGEDSSVKDLDDIRNVMKWLKSPKFDLITVMLVRQFQYVSNIYVDGIVGLETYTALENFIQDISSANNKIYEFEEKRKNTKYPPYPEGTYAQVVELVSVPSYLPSDVLSAMFEKLESSAKDAIEKSMERNKAGFSTIQKKILSNSFVVAYFQEISKSNGKIKLHEDILRKMFESEFLILEPIASVILKIISPISQFDSPLSEIMKSGFCIYEELLSQGNNNKWRETLQKKSPIHFVALKHENGVDPDLAILALQRTWNSLRRELELLKHIKKDILEQIKSDPCGQKPENEEIKRKLYFYLLAEKFVEHNAKAHDIILANDGENNSEKENQKTNKIDINFKATQYFSKRESFELVLENSEEEGKSTRNSTQPNDFITPPQIQVLLSSSFLTGLRLSSIQANQDRPKRKFLFLPNVVDLSFWCSAVRDQGNLKSCSAFVGTALLEYFTHRYQDRYTEVSPLFLYKVTRNLMGTTDDIGSSLRATMKAMATFGVAPEEYWPYEETKVNVEPSAICYSLAEKYQALKYFRLDYAGISQEMLLFQIKAVLAAGFPCGFGVTLYSSAYKSATLKQGIIPYPNVNLDKQIGGHAFVAVGYDNYRVIPHADPQKPSSQGAFLIRNSQGTEWGIKGYAWLPYDYVMEGLTADWWSLLKAEWLKSTTLGLAAIQSPGDPIESPTEKP